MREGSGIVEVVEVLKSPGRPTSEEREHRQTLFPRTRWEGREWSGGHGPRGGDKGLGRVGERNVLKEKGL